MKDIKEVYEQEVRGPSVIHTDTPDTITTTELARMTIQENERLKKKRALIIKANREKIAQSKRNQMRLCVRTN